MLLVETGLRRRTLLTLRKTPILMGRKTGGTVYRPEITRQNREYPSPTSVTSVTEVVETGRLVV